MLAWAVPVSVAFAQTAASENDSDVDSNQDPIELPDFDSFQGDDSIATFETVIEGDPPATSDAPENRSSSEVTRADMARRLPRSAPDALRYEPGVFVQQTAHSQGSAYIRGMTGQQTLILFDGIRINNSTYRQGPNQYFFTLDSATIDSIEVLRGGSSTLYGSDALGGVILAHPIAPRMLKLNDSGEFRSSPHVIYRMTTQDLERGGRVQTDAAIGDSVGFFGGVGFRRVEELESGGPIHSPTTGEEPLVPRFREDGRTQIGTGFDEFTADGAMVIRLASKRELKLSAYTYRQFDAPRTDQCPAAYAPYNECLMYEEQFRNLVYVAYQAENNSPVFRGVRATVSFQQQHERRRLNRPTANIFDLGKDVVNTVGAGVIGLTRSWALTPWLKVRLDYGLDNYFDMLDSKAWTTFTDISYTRKRSRGQYLDGSTYLYGGAYLQGKWTVAQFLALHGGGRFSWIAARAPEDPESGSAEVSRQWFPWVGNAGVEFGVRQPFSVLVNVDRSYRAPNLDDLTSRQQTGPGFQFENASLHPEHALTYEAGLRWNKVLNAELWGFFTHLDEAIVRSPRQSDDCPPNTPQCEASWNRFQLVNASDRTVLRGIEGVAYADMAGGFSARTTVAWLWGEGPNSGDPPTDSTSSYERRVPVSRVPPLNGTVELLWKNERGLSIGSTLRWAGLQDRLALSDVADERIPAGGTPGFAVVDLRTSYRPHDDLLMSLTFENVFDSAYRYHGSAVNGPGRGVMFMIDVGPMWNH
ncbi:MAG: TonB-dependent receptor [Deltaproteobacteria bacterium]|nr:TonB-dependent receptor [Deltaproteobacteria bacterium]